MKKPSKDPAEPVHETADDAPIERAEEGVVLTDEDEKILDRVWRDVGK